jgi:uncharacterized protein
MNITEVKNSEWSLSNDDQGSIVEGSDDINQCLYNILFTVPGSDPTRPDFGCEIYKYIDTNPLKNINSMIKAISDAIFKWETRVGISSISYFIQNENIQFGINWTTEIKTGSSGNYTIIPLDENKVAEKGFNYLFDFTITR